MDNRAVAGADGGLREPLRIRVSTEDGAVRSGVTASALGELLAGLGQDDNRFAVVERELAEADVFIQAWRGDDGVYDLEHRAGSAEPHVGTRVTGSERLTALVVAWVHGEAGWGEGLDWEPVDLVSTPELDDRIRQEAEEHARLVMRCGFADFWGTVRAVSENFDPEVQEVTMAQANRIVAGLWGQRLAEEASWPAVTGPDRLQAAFTGLEGSGITARMDFACCNSCAFGEIGEQAAEGARGYVFFHHQDTERVAESGVLWLTYGAFPGSPSSTVSIGEEVANALTAAGLTVDWDGTPERALKIPAMDWRKRLPQ